VKVSSIDVRGFRSIDHAALSECGALNVLIGKNNSGKSNLLSAMQIFFGFLKESTLVASAKPPIGEATDWFERKTEDPVILTASLALTEDEMAQVRAAISNEAPQMRRAIEEVSSVTSLECELIFYRRPRLLGYISRISFDGQGGDGTRSIFGLTREAATEFVDRDQTLREFQAQLVGIERLSLRFDADNWRLFKDREASGSSGSLVRALLSDYPEDLNAALTSMIRSAESYDEYRDRLSTFTSEIRGRISELHSAETRLEFQTFSGESRAVPKYVSTIVNLIANQKVHHLLEQRKPIGQGEASRILRLKTSRGQGHVLKDIQNTVAELLGVEIDAFSSDSPPTRTSGMSAELDVDDFLVQVNGSGIREALRLVLDYEFERPEILMVEEPEVHLHPALEITMMQYLRKISASCQIFLTTHSTNFLDTADLRNVYLITKDNSTHSQLLNVEEAEEAIPQELGIRLSSLFMYDRLVFVEGPSDEQVLRTLASTLGLNLSRAGIGFVTTGGARNFSHYANAATLAFLAKRRVKLFFILDRDERDLPEIVKLQGQVAAFGELTVLQRRELENYMLDPRTLSRYLSSRTGSEVTITDVEEALKQATDTLLETAVERRVLRLTCRPVFPDREAVISRGDADFTDALREQLTEVEKHIAQLKENIPTLLTEVRTDVDSYSPDKKLASIPGDAILEFVFNKYGLRFSKRKDGPKIASMMSVGEIPSEISGILGHFTTS
jgi:putative ATP-dependent endonuclease of the OLD family